MSSKNMSDEIKVTPDGTNPVDSNDIMPTDNDARTTDIIPDEVPRKDGPGGEGSES